MSLAPRPVFDTMTQLRPLRPLRDLLRKVSRITALTFHKLIDLLLEILEMLHLLLEATHLAPSTAFSWEALFPSPFAFSTFATFSCK